MLIIGQIFLVGAIIQSDKVHFSDVPAIEDAEIQYDMDLPEGLGDEMSENDSDVEDCKDCSLDEVAINRLIFREEKPFEVLDLELGRKVKIFKKNQGGKLLRLRIMPTIEAINSQDMQKINSKFSKFSVHRTDKYTEFVISAHGRVGNPYVATSSEGLFRLSIPFQLEDKSFILPVTKRVAEGVTFHKDRVPIGKRFSDVFVLRVQPFAESIKVIPVLANEGIAQKEVLSSMAKRYNAIAAINGAYFTSRGDPIGTLIINRHLISSPLYKRSVFGVTEKSEVVFGNPDFSGRLISSKLNMKIDAVNQPRRGNQVVVYTPEYSRSTLTTEPGVELVLVKGKVVGIHARDTLIPPDGVVVSAGGESSTKLAGIRLGEKVELDYSIDKPWDLIKHAVCGGPRLLSDGKIDINGDEEKFSSSIVYGRHPRTAIALTFDGDLLLVVVDGRSKRNSGMKLKELATYLKRLGARHAINLDGGGSTSMIVNGKTINKPSDGRERRISNGILITGK